MDTYWLVAAVTGWTLAGVFVLLSGVQAFQIRSLREALEATGKLLKAAQRNDHRDTKGRYASLEDVCIPPGNYPANR